MALPGKERLIQGLGPMSDVHMVTTADANANTDVLNLRI